MCTAQPRDLSDDEDKIWADSSDDGQGIDHSELEREATARHQHFYNAGYRDGLEEGKERTLQKGFNLGFRAGTAAGFEWGMLQGATKTLAALDGQAAGTRGLHDQIQALQAAIDVPPRGAMLALYRHILSPRLPIAPSPPQHPDTAAARASPFQLKPQGLGTQTENQGGSHDPLSVTSALEGLRVNGSSGTQGQDAAELLEDAFTAALSPISTRMAGIAAGAATLGDNEAAKAIVASTSGRSATGLWGSAEGSSGAHSGETGSGIALGVEEALPLLAVEAAAVSTSTAELPLDADLLDLPDLPRIMADVRRRLVGLGIELGTVPDPSGTAV
ncbi:hypothetical protein VaNZ11_005182 [Volvox africanus]|uniref:Essential protein Yae1 N-terminal domain-containing protein n=1 Tax=Volvox africanus TaxID=51714 RepID=A0ABQ5RZF0_9CHLO|nr:hypothetical protein VaNZ11_005182 [Volvox africanus]